MTTPRFLQIHTLHSYPAALLNRDDSGLAKRMPFGNAVRTRISSQCLKRHWRVADGMFSIRNIANSTSALRSQHVIDRRVIAPLRERTQASDEVLEAVKEALEIGVYGDKAATAKQPLLLGAPEVNYLMARAESVCAEHPDDPKSATQAIQRLFKKLPKDGGERNNFSAFRQQVRLPGGLEGALFGRMVTSDPKANIDAAVHVAHAFTTHEEESESDYFTVVDDLLQADETGASHIGDSELTSGVFYGYVVVDIPGLVSNLEGCPASDWQEADRTMAGDVIKHLLHLISTVSPGAKPRFDRPLQLCRFHARGGRRSAAPQPGERLPHSRPTASIRSCPSVGVPPRPC